MKCLGISRNGKACPYNARPNKKYCGNHKRFEDEIKKKEPIKIKSSYEEIVDTDIVWTNIADIAQVRIGRKNRSKNCVIIEMKADNYTTDDLEKYYANTENILFRFKKNLERRYQYFIRMEVSGEKIVLIVLCKDCYIINFATVSDENFDKVKDFKFYLIEHYIRIVGCSKTLHELIKGKKAEKGGWKLIYQNDPEYSVEPLWITMISGRSIDKYDPDPENANFLYYYDEINNCNVKIKKWDKKSNWLPENPGEFPDPNLGNIFDYYKNPEGKIYVKIDQFFIDHVNSDSFDNRNINIREITCSANASNYIKNDGYYGVRSNVSGTFEGKLKHKEKFYYKNFDDEKDAATFYDYYMLALNGVEVSNNECYLKKKKKTYS